MSYPSCLALKRCLYTLAGSPELNGIVATLDLATLDDLLFIATRAARQTNAKRTV